MPHKRPKPGIRCEGCSSLRDVQYVMFAFVKTLLCDRCREAARKLSVTKVPISKKLVR